MDPDELMVQALAVRHVATRLKIADIDFKSTNELLVEIQSKDAQTRGLLTDFMNAHADWHHFNQKVARRGYEHGLSPQESEEQAVLVGRKDNARSAIVTRCAGLT